MENVLTIYILDLKSIKLCTKIEAQKYFMIFLRGKIEIICYCFHWLIVYFIKRETDRQTDKYTEGLCEAHLSVDIVLVCRCEHVSRFPFFFFFFLIRWV